MMFYAPKMPTGKTFMNSMFGFMKQHGLKAILPLLLLMTACTEETNSTAQLDTTMPDLSDVSLSEGSASATSSQVRASAFTAGPRAQFDLDAEESASDDVSLLLADPLKEGAVSEDADATAESVAIASQSRSVDIATVPEPTGVIGLIAAGVGLVAIKRAKA